MKYLTFPPPSCSQKCVGFHVLQTAHSRPSCVPQSKATTSGVSPEKRNTQVVPRTTQDEKEKNKQSAAPRAERGPDMPAARGTSSWSDSAILPAADSEESWGEMETRVLEEPWFTLKKNNNKRKSIYSYTRSLALL